MCGLLETVQDPDEVYGPVCPQCPHGQSSHGAGEVCASGCDRCDCSLTARHMAQLMGGTA